MRQYGESIFVPAGDRELWVAKDDEFQLPVYALPGRTKKYDTDSFLICAATSLEPDQAQWLRRQLDAITSAKVGPYWLARRKRAELVLRKAPGITPARYVVWNGHGEAPIKVDGVSVAAAEPERAPEEMTVPGGADAFVRYVANTYSIDDLRAARLMWYRFCQAAVNWMLVEGRPLEMFWGVVRVFPYRKNWQAIMAAKFPGFTPVAKIENPERLKQAIAATLIGWQLEQPEMASMSEAGLIGWTADMELRQTFHDHATDHERRQMEALNPVSYYKRWLHEVRRRFDGTISSFRSFWNESARPVADVDRSLPAHRRFLRWALLPGKVRPAAPPPANADYCTGSEPDDDQPKRQKASGHSQALDLPEVPDKDIAVDMRSLGGGGQ